VYEAAFASSAVEEDTGSFETAKKEVCATLGFSTKF